MTPTDPTQEEAAAANDPIRMALGALVATCYAGYRRAKQVASGPAHGSGEAVTATGTADPAPRGDGRAPRPGPSQARPAR